VSALTIGIGAALST